MARRKWNEKDKEARRRKAAIEKLARATKNMKKAQDAVAALITEEGNVITFGPKIEQTRVSSPTVANAVDLVRTSVDQIDKLRRAGRISALEQRAAQAYRMSFDVVSGRLGGVMDFDRARGGGQGRGYSEAELIAAETLSSASKILSPMDVEMLDSIIGHGLTCAEFALAKFGGDKDGKCSKENREYAERRLIDATKQLVACWYPAVQERPQGIRTLRDTGDLVEEKKSA
jgi:hypothetical protein